jgi:putative phosphoesterase
MAAGVRGCDVKRGRYGSRYRVGVISDTHGLLRPEAVHALRGSDMIVHAGDIGSPDVLRGLEELAPVIPVRGNNDRGPWADALPLSDEFELGSASIHVIHDIAGLQLGPPGEGRSVVISGHSHTPRCEERDGILFLNPGSAGPRRFRLPISVGFVHIDGRRVEGSLQTLEIRP